MLSEGLCELLEVARKKFKVLFGKEPSAAAAAPGRVNLIGDHVDYNDGFVLPVALPLSTVLVGSYNDTSRCNITSLSENGEELQCDFEIPSVTPLKPGQPDWANYVKGVVTNFPSKVDGFDAVIISDVPMGAGVSSSASLEVAVFTFLESLTGIRVEPKNKALYCQKAEHEFAGMPCGIMDQFISAMGKKDHALLIDCRSLEWTLIKIGSKDVKIVVTNSNVKHELTGSEYAQRRSQCQKAAEALGKRSLRSAKLEDLKELERLNVDELVIRRAKHVINEIERTKEAAECLSKSNFNRVGELFYESHESMSKLFEASCAEMDELVDIAKGVPGVLGSRMTGGGFGGCTVTLVREENVEDFIKETQSKYKGNPIFFLCSPSDGAQIIPLKP